MEMITCADLDALSRTAASFIVDAISKQPSCVLGLATGSTPLGTYRELIKRFNHGEVSFNNVRTINLDEYVGLEKQDPNSYYQYMNRNLFSHIDIRRENIHIPDGTAGDLSLECIRYDNSLDRLDGFRLQILGLGRNGHIGFNEPGTPFDLRTHTVRLTESTRKANARFFKNESQVPESAITMGIQDILSADVILLLVAGASKEQALKTLMESDRPDEKFPATVLKRHKRTIILADRKARGGA